MNENTSAIADFHSLQSFLTSYLIGCANYKIIEVPCNQYELILFERIRIPLLHKSLTGFHVFSTEIFELMDGKSLPLNFYSLVEKICFLEKTSSEQSALFQSRVKSSHDTIKRLIDSDKDSLNFHDQSFQRTEQSLIFGHFSHPYPKLQEQDAGSFDFEGPLNLHWCFAHKSILHCEHSHYIEADLVQSILKAVYLSEMRDARFLDDVSSVYSLFPIHPAQFDLLTTHPLIQAYITHKKLILLDKMKVISSWTPTTSVRTIYNENSSWMLKFSLNLRLTNSVRVLQSNEVKRGIQVHEVFKSSTAEEIAKDKQISSLQIMHEPLFLALKDENQNIINNSIVVLRENPFKKEDQSICLAVLNQKVSPGNFSQLSTHLFELSSMSNISYNEKAYEWFNAFLDSTVVPLVLLQARFGIYFGAHQQNLVLKLNEHFLPEKCYYRDCQGSGYSAAGFERFKSEAKSLNTPNGNVLPVDYANSLMGYYLFINSTLFTIHSLARGDNSLEQKLISTFIDKIRNLEELNDHSFVDYILKSKTLLIKDNFECCLKNINENLIEDPLSIYKEMMNPFYQDLK